jgi:hypothetical protein
MNLRLDGVPTLDAEELRGLLRQHARGELGHHVRRCVEHALRRLLQLLGDLDEHGGSASDGARRRIEGPALTLPCPERLVGQMLEEPPTFSCLLFIGCDVFEDERFRGVGVEADVLHVPVYSVIPGK